MPFSIHAEITDPVTGEPDPAVATVTETAATMEEAVAKARILRASGYSVGIRNETGEPVPEEDEGD